MLMFIYDVVAIEMVHNKMKYNMFHYFTTDTVEVSEIGL